VACIWTPQHENVPQYLLSDVSGVKRIINKAMPPNPSIHAVFGHVQWAIFNSKFLQSNEISMLRCKLRRKSGHDSSTHEAAATQCEYWGENDFNRCSKYGGP